ncbi:MAG: hypothetical protein ACK4PI_02575 [Tepidisphaerales bacterium]
MAAPAFCRALGVAVAAAAPALTAASPARAANVSIINFNDDLATASTDIKNFGTTYQTEGNARTIVEPFSLAQPWFTVNAEHYPALAGGAYVRWSNTADISPPIPLRRIQGTHPQSPNRVQMQFQGMTRSDSSVASAEARVLTVVPQSRFNALSTGRVAFDSASFLSVRIAFQTNVDLRTFNWVVQDGNQWFINRTDMNFGFGVKTLTNPNAANWVPFEPTLPNFGNIPVTMGGGSPHTFTDIKAVGMLWNIVSTPGINPSNNLPLVSQVDFSSWIVNAVPFLPDPPPSSELGDFNFDGFIDAGDIDPFLEALLESAPYAEFIANYGSAYTAQYGGTLTPDVVVAFGDFDANGIFDAGDIDPFVEAVLSSRPGMSAIPEPAALGLLAPATLLLVRRRTS